VAAVLPHRAGPAGAAPDHPGQAGPPRRPGTIEQLNAALVAKLAQGKLLRARKLRVDTTVVAADIDYPTDADLLEVRSASWVGGYGASRVVARPARPSSAIVAGRPVGG
jgi:hypothetical protein